MSGEALRFPFAGEGRATAVTLLTTRFWPDQHGGLENKMWHQANAMADLGLSVTVLTENRVNAPPSEWLRPNLVVHRLPVMETGRLWRWMEPLRAKWWFNAIRTHAPAGAICASDPLMATAAILAGRRNDLIYQPLACRVTMNRVAEAYPSLANMKAHRIVCLFDRFAYFSANSIIFESQNARQQFARAFGDRSDTHVVTNGVTPRHITDYDRLHARRRLGIKANQWVVGFVGRLDGCKDVAFLLRALHHGGLGENGRLLIAGDGPLRNELEQLARALNLNDQFIWAGRLDDPTTAYAAMNVLVLPSVCEVFGNVILEAMACGVPAIGRRRDADAEQPVYTASEELIEHGKTGMLVDAHDVMDLSNILTSLSHARLRCVQMGLQARRHVNTLTWHNAVAKCLDITGIPYRRDALIRPAPSDRPIINAA